MSLRTSTSGRLPFRAASCLVSLAVLTHAACAQRIQPQPVTDSSAQASPLAPVLRAPAADTSAQASPIAPGRTRGLYVSSHTPIAVTLDEAIDSGKLKQGQNLRARLTGSVAVHGGVTLPPGTPVVVTVIETVPAGRIMAQGEFSLQVIRVGSVGVYTDTLVFDGKPGHQDLPDSAPALGTDAGLPDGAPLTFHVLPPPTAADSAPPNRSNGPGSVDGVASGGPPPAGALKSTFNEGSGGANSAGSGNTPGQHQPAVSSGNTTTNQQTEHPGQTSTAPNQPQSPLQSTPDRTQPR